MAERRRWLIVLSAVVLLGVATAVAVPMLRDDNDGATKPTVCEQARDRFEAVAATTPTTVASLDLARQRTQAQTRFNAIEEMAILAEQNASCFTPTERAAVERAYRQWKAAGFG